MRERESDVENATALLDSIFVVPLKSNKTISTAKTFFVEKLTRAGC